MKIRNGFVSNSSSSSFVIQKKYLSEHQLNLIRDVDVEARRLGLDCFEYVCDWEITETDDDLKGWTYMDNFQFDEFLDIIGVDMRYVKMDGENC